MPYVIEHLLNSLDHDGLQQRIERLLNFEAPRLRRLWFYYRNPMLPLSGDSDSQGSDRPYRQAQEWGLPSRITGVVRSSSGEMLQSQPVEGVARKEVVIENDIAWRIETLVDYLFGKPIVINSRASDAQRREQIEQLVRAILLHNGGITFLQQLALLGAIYGFVDVLVKLRAPGTSEKNEQADPSSDGSGPSAGPECLIGSLPPQAEPAPGAESSAAPASAPTRSSFDSSGTPGASTGSPHALFERIARMVRLEIVEPARALPLVCPSDWRIVEAYVQVYKIPEAQSRNAPHRSATKRGLLHRILDRFAATRRGAMSFECDDQSTLVTEVLTATKWQRYENEKLVAQGTNSLGILPLVHIQNTAVPFEYSGSSDVEPLVPLQDELNTRLCDRAHRITMQSFKMYLGKNVEGFNELPVAPGRMWMTDNENADVIEFGGDSSAPSEDRHIVELREALDKTSSVTPIAAGAIKGRIGHLTSAVALRVTLMALLAKTERKRTTYGEGLVKMLELALAWLDHAGIFHTTPDDRRIEIHWPNPLPVNEMERLEEARLKQQLGIPPETVLRELGY